jgi:hypothetical protein
MATVPAVAQTAAGAMVIAAYERNRDGFLSPGLPATSKRSPIPCRARIQAIVAGACGNERSTAFRGRLKW